MRKRAAPRSRPLVVVMILAAVGVLLFALPILGILVETPWRDLPVLLSSDVVVSALRLSLISSLSATLLSVLFGVPVAFVLARSEFRLKVVVRGLVLLPLVLPPVVGGAALLLALGRRGLLGEPVYNVTGFVLPFSLWGVIAATTFVAMPFLIITVEAALRNLDGRLEGAAESLGAGAWTVLRRITLPMIYPALVSGIALTWARAFGEFGATITFAGNLQGRTQTLPLAVFVALEADRPTAIAISLLMIVVSMTVLILLRDRWWPSS